MSLRYVYAMMRCLYVEFADFVGDGSNCIVLDRYYIEVGIGDEFRKVVGVFGSCFLG